MTSKSSEEIKQQAMKVAKATQKPNQSKEQTKLIAQGIEKGIAEYKKQQKKKSRERDKQRKAQLKQKAISEEKFTVEDIQTKLPNKNNIIPWVLLALSWLIFLFVALYSQ